MLSDQKNRLYLLGLVLAAEPVSTGMRIRKRLRCIEVERTAERRQPVVLAVERLAGTVAVAAAVSSRCTAAEPERLAAAGRPGIAAGRPELDPERTV